MAQEKILKLLDLTTSENDAEALNAIRKANDVRERAGLQWEDVFAKSLGRHGHLPPSIKRWPSPSQFLTVERMFEEILHRNLSDILRSQIEQLKFVYEWTESLSGDEMNTLINTYHHNMY